MLQQATFWPMLLFAQHLSETLTVVRWVRPIGRLPFGSGVQLAYASARLGLKGGGGGLQALVQGATRGHNPVTGLIGSTITSAVASVWPRAESAKGKSLRKTLKGISQDLASAWPTEVSPFSAMRKLWSLPTNACYCPYESLKYRDVSLGGRLRIVWWYLLRITELCQS